MKQLIVFDLDGTLLDTVGDLAFCCNEVLKQHGLPEHEVSEYHNFVGNGVKKLVERALPEKLREESFVDGIVAEFKELYSQNIATYTKPYEGIEALLKALSKREMAIAVASNKFQSGVEKLLHHYFADVHFVSALGQREGIALKPDPYIIREIIQRTSYTPDKMFFVGDSSVDIATAKAAGVESIAVTWGFSSAEELEPCGATHIVEHPAQILSLLD